MTAALTPDEIINDYLNAYEASNGRAPVGTITYQNGLFVFSHPNLHKVQRPEILGMIRRLRNAARRAKL